MEIHELEGLDLPSDAIAAWHDAGLNHLTALQEAAFTNAALLSGSNTLVIAPTSAGKTFVGEVLAVRAAANLRRTLYVVPFKALAEEKYAQFRDLYGPLGIGVAVSSGDRDEFDDDIKRGRYLITVVVYEKLAQLIVQSPGLLSECGLVVLDEVQLVRDETRGPGIEMLLTRLITASKHLQIVALSATVGALNRFDAWLGAEVVESRDRPIPLDEFAVNVDGTTYTYDRNSRLPQRQSRISIRAGSDAVGALAASFVQRDLQVLIFHAHVPATEETARSIAASLPRREIPADIATALGQLEDSESRVSLEQCLMKGVAFHNAGLSFEERNLVETAFRQGVARVLVSTTTLAMGVNLPADAVIVADTRRYLGPAVGTRLIDIAEYKNCAGRAGRLGHAERGEAYLNLTAEDFSGGMIGRFIGGTPEAIESAIPRSRLVDHVLRVIASRFTDKIDDVHNLFASSFAAATFYARTGHQALTDGITAALEELRAVGMIDIDNAGGVTATAVGEVVARSGISVPTGAALIQFLANFPQASEAEMVFEVCSASEISGGAPYLRREERGTPEWRNQVRALAGATTSGSRLDHAVTRPMLPSDDVNALLKRSCLVLRWLNGESSRQLTRDFRIGLGYIRGLGENVAWISGTLSQIAVAMELDPDVAARLNRLSSSVHYGVPYEAVRFAKLRVPGVNRNEATRLVQNETGRTFTTYDAILDAEPSDFLGIVSPGLLPLMQEAILKFTKESLRRYASSLLARANKLSLPLALIRNLVESQGNDFELAIRDLLNSPGIELSSSHISRQRAGEADIHISHPQGGTIVIQATSSEDNAKPITWNKCREVFGSTSVPGPIRNFVVVGKPDFQELAQSAADEIAPEGERRILLLPVGVLGDLCLSVVEGVIDRARLIHILTDEQGYLGKERLTELLDLTT